MDGGERFGMCYTPDELMTIIAARTFRNHSTCFVGVGLPSVAACLARRLHAPAVRLVYESGAIGAKPATPPLSIADPELAGTADFIVSVPEIFAYWLQGGRIDTGFLGAAQLDRFANLNSTVIGDYRSPRVRLPGAGGAPHIAAHAKQIVVIVRQTPKVFVSRVDFVSTPPSKGSTTVVTDLGILEKHRETGELVLTAKHPGVTVNEILSATGWPLAIAGDLIETPAPTEAELRALRNLA
jgi:glutaconate CoA-transferase subunit B